MHKIIIWIIQFCRIPLVLTCFVFVFFYAVLISFVEIETIIKRNDKMDVKNEFGDISCYYKNDEGVLPSTEDRRFSPKDKSIFFIDSSCKGKLTMMQACVAESAAISNPQRHIYVLLSFPITDSLSQRYLAELLTYPNVNVARIHIDQYVKDTEVESMLVNYITQSRHPMEDTSNILKIVTLYKWGGILLDSDMIVLRSFKDLPKNWVVKQDKGGIKTGSLSFTRDDFGRNITREILKELVMTYDPKSKRFNRLEAIVVRVLKRICPKVSPVSEDCYELTVFSEYFFYPLRIPGSAPYDDGSGLEVIETEMPYTYPLRSMEFSSYRSNEEWPYDSLGKIFCPRLFELKASLK